MQTWKKVLIIVVCVMIAIVGIWAIVNNVNRREMLKQKAIEVFVEAGKDK